MSLFERINTKLIREKKEPLSDEEKLYRTTRNKKAKDLGYKSGAELERTVDRGIKAVDKKPGGRYPRKGYATGEPFQPDNNPATIKGTYDKKSGQFVKTPGTGKYETSGKKTLRGRLVDYPSMDKNFSKAVKSGEVERDVAKRLKTRLKYTAGTELGGDKGVDKFVSKVMKNQKGTIGTGTGKDSDLYKILKRDIDNRNPTVPSDVINPKTGTRFRKPMPGGFDADGGRTGTKAQQNRYDARAQSAAKRFDREIAKQAKLPKGLKIPKGGETRIDPKTGIERASTELDPKELNVKYKAAKLKLDYGGRMAKRDPKYQAMTSAQKKANFEKLKKTIYNKKSSQPFKGPQTFSTYKYDRKNIVPTGLKGKGQPKFKDIRNTIPYRSTTKDRLKLGKRDLSAFSKKMKFGRLRTPTKAIKYKKTFGDFAKIGAKRIGKLPLKGKLALGAAVVGGLLYGGNEIRKKLRGPVLGKDDFTKTAPIKYGSGSKESDRPKGKKIGDTVRFQYASKDDPNVKDKAGPSLTPDALNKFKTKKYSVKTKSGKNYDLVDRMKKSAFAQQVKQAQKRKNKKDQAFLKRVKNSPEVKGY